MGCHSYTNFNSGKITNLEITPGGETQSATVTFEKETAAKTALLLDNTQLGSTHVQVSSATGSNEDDGSHYTTNTERDSDEITQEVCPGAVVHFLFLGVADFIGQEKPRSRIIAEYLAHGYVIGDQAAQRAIELDQKHGVSNRFLSTLQSLDQKYHATDKAKSVDQSYGVTPRVNSLLTGLTSYYDKAASTPTGQKFVNFYTQTSRQVQDIHTEARRLADLKKKDAGIDTTPGAEKTTCKCASDSGNCPCAPGTCTCPNCDKSDVKKVPGTNKTTCNCGGNTENCPCAPGECACTSYPKTQTEKVADSDKTTCKCGGDSENCPCALGKCACKSRAQGKTEAVAGTNKTTCNCGGDDKSCPCEAGKCACSGCAK